nr:hypothetical protein [Tanacetum cinerariifolium]
THGIAVGTSVSKRFNLDKWPILVFSSASKNNRVNDDKNRMSSLLHYSSGYDSLVLENAESVLAELPPTPGLVEVVNVLVKYLNSSLVSKVIDRVEVTALRRQLLL